MSNSKENSNHKSPVQANKDINATPEKAQGSSRKKASSDLLESPANNEGAAGRQTPWKRAEERKNLTSNPQQKVIGHSSPIRTIFSTAFEESCTTMHDHTSEINETVYTPEEARLQPLQQTQFTVAEIPSDNESEFDFNQFKFEDFGKEIQINSSSRRQNAPKPKTIFQQTWKENPRHHTKREKANVGQPTPAPKSNVKQQKRPTTLPKNELINRKSGPSKRQLS